MKYDNAKWLVPLFSFVVYLSWVCIMYLIDSNYKSDMTDLFLGMIFYGIFGIAFVMVAYIFIPVTQYFYEKGVAALSVYIAMASLLPSLTCSYFLSNGSDWGKTFLVVLTILSGFNVPYFLTLILILKDRSNNMSGG